MIGPRIYGEPPLVLQSLVTPTVTVGAAPVFTAHYTYSSRESLPAVRVRFQVMRSDHTVLRNGTLYYFDTDWLDTSLASGGSATYDIDAVEAGVPTDTGAGSVDPTLHLVVRVLASYSTDPESLGNWVMAESAPFDLQWGTSTLSWVSEPSNLVSTENVSAAWAFSSTRGGVEANWEVQLTSTDGSVIYYDTGETPGNETSFIVPFRLENNTNYRLLIFAWNNNGIPATPLSVLFVAGDASIAPQFLGGPLARFLDLIGFQLDISRSMAEQLRFVNDPLRCPGSLLPLLAQQLGVSYEAEMGMAQTRKLLSTIVHQYKMKGTPDGVRGISTAITGWPAEIDIGPNQMLSSVHVAEPLVVPTGDQVATVTSSTGPGGPTRPSGYIGTGWPTTWPVPATPIPANVALYNPSGSTVAASVTWDSLQGGSAKTNGIPIPPGSTLLSVGTYMWLAGLTAAPTLTLTVSFWDSNGSLVSTATAAPTMTQNTWNQIKKEGVAVPTGAVWASYKLSGSVSFTGTNGVTFQVGPQAEFSSTLSSFSPPRAVQIKLGADRTNFVANPSMENGTTAGWTASGSFALSAVSGVAFQPPGVPTPGTHSLLVSNPGAHQTATVSTVVTVPEGVTLATFSAYLRPQSTARPVTVTMTAKDGGGTTLGMAQTLTPIQEVPGDWVRAILATDPRTPVPDGVATIQVDLAFEMASGEGHYIDCVMLEDGWLLIPGSNQTTNPYFDADLMQGDPQASDYFWFDAFTKIGPSYYYRNFAHKIVRLNDVLTGRSNTQTISQRAPLTLTGFLPVGTDFSLVTPLTL